MYFLLTIIIITHLFDPYIRSLRHYHRCHRHPYHDGYQEKIISTLNSVGMRALLLSDFSAETMQYQLALATQADVIIGLHGAGLINILFAQNRAILVELKTPYGYKLDLFTLAAEARLVGHYFNLY